MTQYFKIIFPQNNALNHSLKNAFKLLNFKEGDILEFKDNYITVL